MLPGNWAGDFSKTEWSSSRPSGKRESKSRPDRRIVRRHWRPVNGKDETLLKYFVTLPVARRPRQ